MANYRPRPLLPTPPPPPPPPNSPPKVKAGYGNGLRPSHLSDVELQKDSRDLVETS